MGQLSTGAGDTERDEVIARVWLIFSFWSVYLYLSEYRGS